MKMRDRKLIGKKPLIQFKNIRHGKLKNNSINLKMGDVFAFV